MIEEARRKNPRTKLPLHYWQVKISDEREAVSQMLLAAFGQDGEGWAEAYDWWLHVGEHSFVQPVRANEVGV